MKSIWSRTATPSASSPVPTRVIADQLGLPRERIADFKRWSDAMILASDPRATSAQMIGYAQQIIEMQQFMARAIAEAANNPKNNIVSSVAGVTIPQDAIVELRWASANRDEGQYERAAELDLGREQSRHMAFGYGIHFCAGANLARAELHIVIRQMLERFRNFRLAGADAYESIVHAFVRGPAKLRIAFARR